MQESEYNEINVSLENAVELCLGYFKNNEVILTNEKECFDLAQTDAVNHVFNIVMSSALPLEPNINQDIAEYCEFLFFKNGIMIKEVEALKYITSNKERSDSLKLQKAIEMSAETFYQEQIIHVVEESQLQQRPLACAIKEVQYQQESLNYAQNTEEGRNFLSFFFSSRFLWCLAGFLIIYKITKPESKE